MSPVWVNGKFLDESSAKKTEKWKASPKAEAKVWSTCADCGQDIYETESYWPLADRFVCVWGGCWKVYYEQGLGFHAPAGLDFGVALEN